MKIERLIAPLAQGIRELNKFVLIDFVTLKTTVEEQAKTISSLQNKVVELEDRISTLEYYNKQNV